MLYSLLRPALFALDAEDAHDLTIGLLARAPLAAAVDRLSPRAGASPARVMGLDFPNRVGLAAGLDKNGEAVDGLAALGFGFVEVGTVTPRAQPGNPKPRLFRLPTAEAIINRMGFNNDGVDALLANIAGSRFRRDGGVLGINIGKNFDTPIERAADDYRIGLEKVYAAASYVTVNISSPNTRNLRELQQDDALDALLAVLKADQQRLADRHGKYTPMALKIAPDLDEAQIATIAGLLCRHRVDAVIATNTTLARDGVAGLPRGDEAGGLSGRPLFARSTAVVGTLAKHLAGELPIIAAGGILSGDDAAAKLDAGATLVQVYSGLIFRGPCLVTEIARTLARRQATAATAAVGA
jgi:dihydroorotate dehydrogenase